MVAYQQFVQHVLLHVVGHGRMTRMGKTSSKNDRLTFNKAVSISDEAFAYMVIDDRWLLWKEIAEYRFKNDGKNTSNGDEDDQRKMKPLPGENVINGTKGKWSGDNKTRFSMFGKYAPGRRGFNTNFATSVHVHYCRKIKKHRKNNPQFRINIREWYSQKVVVGIRKRPRASVEEKMTFVRAWCAKDENYSDDESN